MNVHETTLFQVPIGQEDLVSFTTPPSQPLHGAINCNIVTAQLLKIITPGFAEEFTKHQLENISARKQTRYMNLHEWLSIFNNLPALPCFFQISVKIEYSFKELPITNESLATLYSNIFPGFATWIFGMRVDSVGHSFVAAKGLDGSVWLFDPQSRLYFKGEDFIVRYFISQQINHSFLTLHKNFSRTREGHAFDFLYSIQKSKLYKAAEGICPIMNYNPAPDVEMTIVNGSSPSNTSMNLKGGRKTLKKRSRKTRDMKRS